jgi:hypothetical protein
MPKLLYSMPKVRPAVALQYSIRYGEECQGKLYGIHYIFTKTPITDFCIFKNYIGPPPPPGPTASHRLCLRVMAFPSIHISCLTLILQLDSLFYLEGGGSVFLRNFSQFIQNYIPQLRRQYSPLDQV